MHTDVDESAVVKIMSLTVIGTPQKYLYLSSRSIGFCLTMAFNSLVGSGHGKDGWKRYAGITKRSALLMLVVQRGDRSRRYLHRTDGCSVPTK